MRIIIRPGPYTLQVGHVLLFVCPLLSGVAPLLLGSQNVASLESHN